MDLVIIGAGGHGKVVANVALNSQKYKKISFLDDNLENASTVLGLNIINKIDFEFINDNNTYEKEFFVGIGDGKKRFEIQSRLLENRIKLATLIDPFSSISKNCTIGIGSLVCPGSVLGPDSYIGQGTIINNSSTIDHDCLVGDYAHLCPHSSMAGEVKFGNFSVLGTGARIIQGINIAEKCFIGAGAVVINDIPEGKKAVGIPAKLIN